MNSPALMAAAKRDPNEPPPAKLTPEGMILEELRAIRKLLVEALAPKDLKPKGKKS